MADEKAADWQTIDCISDAKCYAVRSPVDETRQMQLTTGSAADQYAPKIARLGARIAFGIA